MATLRNTCSIKLSHVTKNLSEFASESLSLSGFCAGTRPNSKEQCTVVHLLPPAWDSSHSAIELHDNVTGQMFSCGNIHEPKNVRSVKCPREIKPEGTGFRRKK